MIKNLGKQVCSNCGSDQVEIVVWYRPNTKEVVGEYGDGDDDWCETCKTHSKAISEEEYKADLES